MSDKCPKCEVLRDDIQRLQACHEWALGEAKAEIEGLRKSLRRIQSLAGNPDPAEACRLIIAEAAKGKS